MSQDNVIKLAQPARSSRRRGVEIWINSLGDEPDCRAAEIGVESLRLSGFVGIATSEI